MIRRLTIQNWRAYENVTLDLEPGTTFVVARNGIGTADDGSRRRISCRAAPTVAHR
jgi:hypothetical protein